MNTATMKVEQVPYLAIAPDPYQPRKVFNAGHLEELAESIRANGLLQPITVRPNPNGDPKYLIVAGERRWRALGILEEDIVPAIIRTGLTEGQAVKLQLLENIVRQSLNPVEEARAFERFLDMGYSMQELSQTVGLTPLQISWRTQMLNCREDILVLVATGQMKLGPAYEISKLTVNGQAAALRAIQSERLSFDDITALCARIYAMEHQTEIFPETKVTEPQRRLARSFAAAFDAACKSVCAIDAMERDTPGALAEALATETALSVAKIDELVKALGRIKKAIRRKDMMKRVDEVT